MTIWGTTTGTAGQRARRAAVLASAVAMSLAACGGTTSGGAVGSSSTAAGPGGSGATTGPGTPTGTGGSTGSTRPTVSRPDGPTATVGEELTGGTGPFIGAAVAFEPEDGYEQHEYVVEGSADTYTSPERTKDGRWSFTPGGSPADYRTRVVVRRPGAAADFSGTVLVEWLNVSGGVDADPDFTMLREEIIRQGHAWVGVSAQSIGVEGGVVAVKVDVPGAEAAGKGLKGIDPDRYGTLAHPGDAYAFDIFTQVARALRGGGGLGDLDPEHLIAVGESQSAFAMTTYINGVQPLTRAFDGFFVHSRGGAGLPLAAPGQAADIASSISGTKTIFRTDTDVPILDVQTEGDLIGVMGSAVVRQPDTDLIRLWEVAGTAHADTHLVGPTADVIDCGVGINDGPMHVVVKAALRHLVKWVDDGTVPPEQPRIEMADADATTIARDADGIAKGGVRTPPVDVPVRVLSGEKGPAETVICLLMGSTRPLPADVIAARYPSRSDYERQYGAALDDAIENGVVLEEDREALESYAHPELVGA